MFEKFLKRPVFSIVIAVLLLFTGILAINTLPKSQFPNVAPPKVQVSASYPGASAEVLTKSVLIPMEQAINGTPKMRYMTSDATSAGEANIQVFFEMDVDPDVAAVTVQNRLNQVLNQLPPLVQREGIRTMSVQPQMLMYVNLYGKTKNMDMNYVFNYANVNILPELQRLSGVGRAQILGSRQYAMRIWLNPDRMRAYNVSTEEVMDAITEQSVIGSPGRLGQSSGKVSQSLEFVLTYVGRYNKPEQYENIIVRANPEGEILRLKDLGTVELGSEYYDIYSQLDDHPSAAIVLKQNYGSNASDVIEEVKGKLAEMKKNFPPGIDYEISYDVSRFLDASMEEVMKTLRDAFILVSLVVFIFLGDWRSTLVPVLAIPISLVGAFSFMQFFGASINMITLFAMVLAIGIVVDNAIVVVEAVHVKMEEKNCGPARAVKLVLGEISGAIIAITLLMASVFIPIAFLPGAVGVFYRQFSIAMATSIVLSGIIALTLTPVLCAIILKNTHGKKKKSLMERFFGLFNQYFDRFTGIYIQFIKKIINRRLVTWVSIIAFSFGIFGISKTLAPGFIPNEDQGIIYAIVQTPPGSTLEKTFDVSKELQKLCRKLPEVQSVSTLAGYEVLTEGRGSNAGTCLINLKDWSERDKTVLQVIEELEKKSKGLGAIIEFFEPPAVPGYGAAGGFALRLLDKTNAESYEELNQVNKNFMAALRKRKELKGLFTFFTAEYPQYELIIDNDAAMQKGVSIGKAMENLSILIGSSYDLGFIKYGRFFKVFVQADPKYRKVPSDILNLFVQNDRGEMVPYSSFLTLKKKIGLNEITRFNLYTSSAIRGAPTEGISSGEAIKVVQEVARETLPKGYDIDWEGLSYDEVRRGNETVYIFLIVLVFVYLILAAQYESFLLPFVILLSLPFGVFGSLLLVKEMGLANDIYTQVGIIMLVGMLGKNAVLIVEFAQQKHAQGMSIFDAAIEGSKARFRPILMTSLAFIMGLIPLVFANGAGAIANRTIGGAALGGMFLGTIMGALVIPGLYIIFGSMASGKKLIKDEAIEPLSEHI